MRDNDTNSSKGFAFINFASFDAADAALEAMNGQYLCNRPITISFAFKKDSKGERHGSEAERFLAAQNPLPQAERPHQLFADAPPTHPQSVAAMNSQSMQPQMMGQAQMMQMQMMPGPPPGSMFPGPPMPPNLFGQMPFGLPPPPGMGFSPMGFSPMGPSIGMMGPPMSFPNMNPSMMRPQPPPPPPPPPPPSEPHNHSNYAYGVPQPPPPPPPVPPPPPPPIY